MSWATILLHHKDFSLSPSLFLFHPLFLLPNLNDVEFVEREAQKLETEACLFTMLLVNVCLVEKKRNSSIDAFGAAANTDD